MRGLLADVNIQGHLDYLLDLLEARDLRGVLESLELRFVTFPDVGLDRRIDDRTLGGTARTSCGSGSPRTAMTTVRTHCNGRWMIPGPLATSPSSPCRTREGSRTTGTTRTGSRMPSRPCCSASVVTGLFVTSPESISLFDGLDGGGNGFASRRPSRVGKTGRSGTRARKPKPDVESSS
jgi:hypothetical protein